MCPLASKIVFESNYSSYGIMSCWLHFCVFIISKRDVKHLIFYFIMITFLPRMFINTGTVFKHLLEHNTASLPE